MTCAPCFRSAAVVPHPCGCCVHIHCCSPPAMGTRTLPETLYEYIPVLCLCTGAVLYPRPPYFKSTLEDNATAVTCRFEFVRMLSPCNLRLYEYKYKYTHKWWWSRYAVPRLIRVVLVLAVQVRLCFAHACAFPLSYCCVAVVPAKEGMREALLLRQCFVNNLLLLSTPLTSTSTSTSTSYSYLLVLVRLKMYKMTGGVFS